MKRKLFSVLILFSIALSHYAMAQTPDNALMVSGGVCNKVVDDLDDIATAVEECATYEYYQYTVDKEIDSIVRDGEVVGAPVRDGDVITYNLTLTLTAGDFPVGGITMTDTFGTTEFDYDGTTYPAVFTAGAGTFDETNVATGIINITYTAVDGSNEAIAQITLIVDVDNGPTTPPAQVCNNVGSEFTDVYFTGGDLKACATYEYVNYSYTKTLTAIVRDLNGDGTYDPLTETVTAPARAGDRLYYDIDIPDTDNTPAAGVTLYDVYELYMDHVSNSESVTPDETQDLDSQLIGDEPDANLLEGLLTFPAVQAVDPAIEVILELIQ